MKFHKRKVGKKRDKKYRTKVFLDSCLFLSPILAEKNAPKIEGYIREVKKTCNCFVSHLILGEIFNEILENHKKDKNKQLFADSHIYALDLLEGVSIVELKKKALWEAAEIMRDEEDSGGRDSIHLMTAEHSGMDKFVTIDGDLEERFKELSKTIDFNMDLKLL